MRRRPLEMIDAPAVEFLRVTLAAGPVRADYISRSARISGRNGARPAV